MLTERQKEILEAIDASGVMLIITSPTLNCPTFIPPSDPKSVHPLGKVHVTAGNAARSAAGCSPAAPPSSAPTAARTTSLSLGATYVRISAFRQAGTAASTNAAKGSSRTIQSERINMVEQWQRTRVRSSYASQPRASCRLAFPPRFSSALSPEKNSPAGPIRSRRVKNQ